MSGERSTEPTQPDVVWRLLDTSHADPYMNMAIEEAVMRAVGEGLAPPTLRLWQNHNAVIVGRVAFWVRLWSGAFWHDDAPCHAWRGCERHRAH